MFRCRKLPNRYIWTKFSIEAKWISFWIRKRVGISDGDFGLSRHGSVSAEPSFLGLQRGMQWAQWNKTCTGQAPGSYFVTSTPTSTGRAKNLTRRSRASATGLEDNPHFFFFKTNGVPELSPSWKRLSLIVLDLVSIK